MCCAEILQIINLRFVQENVEIQILGPSDSWLFQILYTRGTLLEAAATEVLFEM